MSKITNDGLTQSGTGCFNGLELTTNWISWSVCQSWCF